MSTKNDQTPLELLVILNRMSEYYSIPRKHHPRQYMREQKSFAYIKSSTVLIREGILTPDKSSLKFTWTWVAGKPNLKMATRIVREVRKLNREQNVKRKVNKPTATKTPITLPIPEESKSPSLLPITKNDFLDSAHSVPQKNIPESSPISKERALKSLTFLWGAFKLEWDISN